MSDELEVQEEEIEKEVQDIEDDEITEEEKEEISIIDTMSDEDFSDFMDTGVVPDKLKQEYRANNKKEEKEEVEEESNPVQQQSDSKEDIDYKGVYDTIFKPFKANGKEITPRNVSDVVSLMQMGANYTKKMQAIAPMKKTFESLNKAGIDESKLNFLIDVYNGDQNAIKQLLSIHKVDPIELDMDNTNYVPNNNLASDDEIEFKDLLNDINDSLPKINDIISNKWDAKSKEELFNNTKLLKGLHEEIQMGRFDQIQNILENERTFGRYKGASDLEAYIDIVTKITNYQKAQQQEQYASYNNAVKQNNADKARAAPVHNKGKNQGTRLTAKDLFSMSDEEFNKLNVSDLV